MKLYDMSNWCRQGAEIENYPYIGEVDVKLAIGEVIQIDKEYFVPGVLDYTNKRAGVRKVEINLNPEDKDYESNLICPYCQYEDKDSWEYEDEDEEHECGRCGAIISYEKVVAVEYNSSPVKPPSIVTAKWL